MAKQAGILWLHLDAWEVPASQGKQEVAPAGVVSMMMNIARWGVKTEGNRCSER